MSRFLSRTEKCVFRFGNAEYFAENGFICMRVVAGPNNGVYKEYTVREMRERIEAVKECLSIDPQRVKRSAMCQGDTPYRRQVEHINALELLCKQAEHQGQFDVLDMAQGVIESQPKIFMPDGSVYRKYNNG